MPIEIINVDSVLVYKRLNIGSAKPSQQEREAVRHHVMDCVEPWDPFSVVDFCQQARQAIQACQSRGNWPLLVGGTPLYFKALLQGLHHLPSSSPVQRAALELELLEKGLPSLYLSLKKEDPITAARLHPNDQQRILRALEVLRITGCSMSQLHSAEKLAVPRFPDAQVYWLISSDKPRLHARIESRLEQMLKEGFQEEVEQLMELNQLKSNMPSMRSVGYRQMWQYLEGKCSFLEMKQGILAATRQLAKRQLTWFKAWPEPYHVLDCSNLKVVVESLEQQSFRIRSECLDSFSERI